MPTRSVPHARPQAPRRDPRTRQSKPRIETYSRGSHERLAKQHRTSLDSIPLGRTPPAIARRTGRRDLSVRFGDRCRSLGCPPPPQAERLPVDSCLGLNLVEYFTPRPADPRRLSRFRSTFYDLRQMPSGNIRWLNWFRQAFPDQVDQLQPLNNAELIDSHILNVDCHKIRSSRAIAIALSYAIGGKSQLPQEVTLSRRNTRPNHRSLPLCRGAASALTVPSHLMH